MEAVIANNNNNTSTEQSTQDTRTEEQSVRTVTYNPQKPLESP